MKSLSSPPAIEYLSPSSKGREETSSHGDLWTIDTLSYQSSPIVISSRQRDTVAPVDGGTGGRCPLHPSAQASTVELRKGGKDLSPHLRPITLYERDNGMASRRNIGMTTKCQDPPKGQG